MNGFGARACLVPVLAIFSVLVPGPVLAQAPVAPCPLEGLSRVQPGCARVDEIHDPSGHLRAQAGDTPGDGICLRAIDARNIERNVCSGVSANMLRVENGEVLIPFRLLKMSGMGRLRENIELSDEGTARLSVDRASNRFVMRAEGKYVVAGSEAKHAFRTRLSMGLRPAPGAPAPAPADAPHASDAMQSHHDADAGVDAGVSDAGSGAQVGY